MMTTDIPPGMVETLRSRQDQLLGQISTLTRRRDAREVTLEETLGIEAVLVIELGQIQDRLRMLGEHSYDGCPTCRPITGMCAPLAMPDITGKSRRVHGD
jgi:hypothetical protein